MYSHITLIYWWLPCLYMSGTLRHGMKIAYEHFEYSPDGCQKWVPAVYLENDEGRMIHATGAEWIQYFSELGVSPFIMLDEEEEPAWIPLE